MTNENNEQDVAFGFRRVGEGEKQGLVNEVFSKVAERYDQMNDLMSGGLHRLWKDDFVAMLNPPRGQADFNHLDVAGGTGDVAFRFMKRAFAGLTTTPRDESQGASARQNLNECSHKWATEAAMARVGFMTPGAGAGSW